MANVKASDFPDVYKQLGIDLGDLGCIMLDTEKIVVSEVIPEDALYFKEDDPDSHTQGNVSENEPHVTLLYGLTQPGPLLQNQVNQLLDDWQPGRITIKEVGFFYSSDPEHPDYVTIIALVEVTDNLLEGNARIRMLPHIDTFPEYHPHITLAYVKSSSDWKDYVTKLNDEYAGSTVGVTGLNYGD